MNTKTFNENYELQTTGKGVHARARNLPTPLPEILTADNAPFEANRMYFFFDQSGEAVRQTAGMRREGEFLTSFGLKIIEISKLRTNRDDALADGQRYFKAKIADFQARVKDFELEKSPAKRDLKSYLMARDAVLR